MQRDGGASEHIEVISLFTGSVILSGASACLLVVGFQMAPLPGPVTEASDKEQEHCCQGTTSYLCLLDDNCEILASKG